MSKRNLALLAAIGATTIYGLNHTIAKGIMPHFVGPYGLIMLRVIGAAMLFWMCSLFGPRQQIHKRDLPRLLLCALLGMGFNMLVFFKGLALSTPINSAVLVTTTPIIVLLLSWLFIKETLRGSKLLGIGIGLAGALGLILFGAELRQDA